MAGCIGEELNNNEKTKGEKLLKLDSYILLLRYLRKYKEEEREKLKYNMKILCGELAERQIIVPIDFEPFGDTIYSETLDRELLFSKSAGFIEERKGSIIYKITDRGLKLSDDTSVLSSGVKTSTLEILDELIEALPKSCNNESSQ